MHIPSALVASVIAAGQLFSFVHAHVEMQNPPPFRSKFLQPQAANTDFSMTAPLNPDGSNFPCKGYQNDDLAPTVHLTAGSSFPLELSGSATHNGGSCQLSLSYDGGKNWVVIYSIIGGCPVDTESYTIPVPSDVPNSSRALLAWSWENHTGNREFYMNCAPVTISGSSSNSFTGPRMHQANVFGPPNCVTVEGVDVVYPNPGKFVLFGGSFKGGKTGPPTVLTPCNFNENEDITVTGDGSISSSSNTDTNSTSQDPPASTGSASSDPPSASTFPSSNETPAVDPPAGTGESTSTTLVTSTGTTTVLATPTPGVVTVTVDGNDPPATTGAPVTTSGNAVAGAACSPDGSITCAANGKHWFMCDQGALVDMGSVAAGTTCSNGQITRKRAIPPQLFRRHQFRDIDGWVL